jgi:PIN domain nuclease of toxin-antitoxin system
MSVPHEEAFPSQVDANEIRNPLILPCPLQRAAGLAFRHRDPFDRLLAAQAATDDLSLVSRDPVFHTCGSACSGRQALERSRPDVASSSLALAARF